MSQKITHRCRSLRNHRSANRNLDVYRFERAEDPAESCCLWLKKRMVRSFVTGGPLTCLRNTHLLVDRWGIGASRSGIRNLNKRSNNGTHPFKTEESWSEAAVLNPNVWAESRLSTVIQRFGPLPSFPFSSTHNGNIDNDKPLRMD